MSLRPRFSTLVAAGLVLAAVVLLVAAMLLGQSGDSAGRTVVTVRLWDEQVADAYRASFAEFGREHPDIEVRVSVVAYSTYFDTLRTDVAGGGADDIFWISNAYFAEYADSGRLLNIGDTLGAGASRAWEPSVVDQFTRNGALWAVPQLTDAGIAVYYNADLLAAAGVDAGELRSLRWSPEPAVDTLRPLLARLTVDDDGRAAGTAGFDPRRIRQWGYNAANDLQNIYLNYIGSAGGVFSVGDRFAFDNPQAAAAFEYLVGLINTDHVAPPASATNDNGDFSRNQFLQGRMALFQSGTYNLAAIADAARFRWGVAMLPAGPAGRVSVTNGIAAAGNSASEHPDAVREVLAWMGSTRGNAYLGAGGAAIPAVLAAQRVYDDYWRSRGVDVSPFFRVLDGPRIAAPGGAGFAAGFDALKPYFDEMFLGRRDVRTTLTEAQRAANAAAQR
ncbi:MULTISPECIES: sugar ABC transporter substrate-binding protein [unclassified Mycobacterium]|uniref:ABC transporter substrate-binding protein n=1 Tax=unclassified Mycobacterium TaxID=2642494 RepID=UPI000740450F|nr:MULTISPECIES: sugar ABC transporter substrate-binding protein [unclassified Mycobacterium]KUH80510.1 sugar ABC transporter substrate-binding protein [Mycobacterium sp. GA-1999]KUH89200.1 sugar ABC transporter substrate-binding protein [Mycobacterium sp. GA-0227b]KUH95935.1 sugar ABC transporter substrate-binding protein [Mycobacterium sp. IS-1556]